MKQKNSTDNIIAYLTIVLAMVAAMATAWFTLKTGERYSPNVAFANIGPLSLQKEDFTMRTSLAIQSSIDDADWVIKNKRTLENTLQSALERTDAGLMTDQGPDKIAHLQAQLAKEINANAPQNKMLEIVITDFITSHD
jgi:flagellar basal body-associated protein FliL